MPHPLTHAAAAQVGGTVFLFGGREASPTSQTRRILAIGADGKIRTVGLLPRASSDLAAVALGGRVIVAGGRDGEGHVQDTILTVTPSYRTAGSLPRLRRPKPVTPSRRCTGCDYPSRSMGTRR